MLSDRGGRSNGPCGWRSRAGALWNRFILLVRSCFGRFRLLQQVPGFAVTLVECAGSLRFSSGVKPGVKTDAHASFKCFYRNHVPGLAWRDVCSYEINVFL